MPDGRISRLITTSTTASRIEDGAELRTSQSLPAQWHDGDMVITQFPEEDYAVFFADPEQAEDGFEYRAGRNGYWAVRLERLSADEQGRAGFRVRFEEHHKYIQRRDDEEGR